MCDRWKVRLGPGPPRLLLVDPYQLRAWNRDDLRALQPDRGELLRGRPFRDADDASQSETAGGPRDRSAVVPRAQSRDATSPLLLGEAGDPVPRAADLEHAEALQVLELQPHLALGPFERDRWRSAGDLLHDGYGFFDVLDRHGDSVHGPTSVLGCRESSSPQTASPAGPPRGAGVGVPVPVSPSRCSRGTSRPRSRGASRSG